MKGQTLVVGQIQQVDISDLRIARWNARKTFDAAALEELRSSIKAHGIQVPLIIRVVSGACEIVAGHRRFRAALALWEKGDEAFDRLPCIVRDLDDDAAREIGLVDNLQREDVPPLEEADAYAELQGRLGSIAAVAAKVDKEQAYVAKRLKLCSLTTWSREALREKLITIDHALLLARLAEAEQNAALKWTLDRNAGSKVKVDDVIKSRLEKRELSDDEDEDTTEQAVERVRWKRAWEPETVLRLKEHIECESGIPLDRAPWDLELDDLGVVPCSGCEKNTKANAPLFGDLETGVAICTDGACFKGKTAAFVRIKARMSDGTQTPLNVSWKSTSTPPRLDKETGEPKPEQTFKYGQWLDVGPKSKKCEFTRPAVTVDWDDANQRGFMGGDDKLRKPGEMLQVCIAPKCKTHVKAYGKASGKSAGQQGRAEDPAKVALDRKCAEAREKEEKAIRAKVFIALLSKLDMGTALRMAAGNIWNAAAARKEIFGMFPKISGDLLEALVLFNHQFSRVAETESYWLEEKGVTADRKKLWDLAKLIGVDANAIAAKHFHDAGSIAPACDSLYPKGVKWPKGTEPAKAAEPVKPKKSILSAASRKRIAAVQKKRWSAAAKKKAVRK